VGAGWWSHLQHKESRRRLDGAGLLDHEAGRSHLLLSNTDQKKGKEDHLAECVQSTVKLGGGSVMIWGCITCDGVGLPALAGLLLTIVDGRMITLVYL